MNAAARTLCAYLLMNSVLVAEGQAKKQSKPKADSEVRSLEVKPVIIDASKNPVKCSMPRDLIFQFPFIPGELTGTPTSETLLLVKQNERGRMVLNFSEKIFTATTHPETAKPSDGNKGIKIEPADTKFGRLGTFWGLDFGQYTLPLNGECGFADASDRSTFVIAYFSGPCKITGIREPAAGNHFSTTYYNVVIKSAGFHCLQWDASGKDAFDVRATPLPAQALFTIRP